MGDDRHGGVRDLSETTFRLSQSCCRPEGDQKRSDRGEKFLGYFSLRTSVVQQPETFVQNSNFANASLLRNLVLHYSFHLKTPPWKLWQHENLLEVLVDEGSARVVVNLFPKWVVGSAHVIEPITQILFAQWELTAEKFLEGVTLFCVPNLNISLWINAVPLILLGRGSFGSYKMNIMIKIQCRSWARAREKKITANQNMYAEKFEAESDPCTSACWRLSYRHSE